MHNVSKKVLLGSQLFLLSLLLLGAQVGFVQGAGLKIKTEDYGQWKTRQVRTGISPLDEEGWLRVTVTRVTGYDLDISLRYNTGTTINATLADVSTWYETNITCFLYSCG